MFVSIITDCSDSNALGRKMTRTASLFGFPPIPIPIENDFDSMSDLEASGHLIDTLDAGLGNAGAVLVNKAPRSGKAKKWENGTPFGYFWYKKTLVVSSVDGFALSFVKKLGLTDSIRVFDIPTVMNYAVANNLLTQELADYIITTQFRSFEFVPRVAKWIFDKIAIPNVVWKINEILDAPNAVWFADVFGNLKTTLLPIDVGFKIGKKIKFVNFGEITCYERLKDVPNGETGLIIGSSGISSNRFLEIVIQGGSAKAKFKSKIGQRLKVVTD